MVDVDADKIGLSIGGGHSKYICRPTALYDIRRSARYTQAVRVDDPWFNAVVDYKNPLFTIPAVGLFASRLGFRKPFAAYIDKTPIKS